MKKLFVPILIILSFKCFGQPATPTGYTFINSKYDWLEGKFRTLHIPSGGATQTLYGGWTGAGAPYWDSVGKKLYIWDGASWATVGGNSVTLKTANGDSLSGTGNVVTDYSLRAYAALGSVIKTQTIGLTIDNCISNIGLPDGQVRGVPVWVPDSTTITGVKWFQVAAGNYTADNYNGVALYSYSGGNMTLVDTSDNDGNIWKQATTTWGTKAFHTTHSIAPGLYFVALLYNNSAQVTAPTIATNSILTNPAVSSMDFTNSAKWFWLINSATMPAPTLAMSATIVFTSSFYVALY